MRKEHPGLSRADTDRADWTSQIGRAYWRWIEAVADVGSTLAAGRGAVSSRAAGRLASLVDFARAHSPVYRDLYQDLGEGPPALSRLPVVTRPALMARFDGWVSDREVNRTSVERFAADPSRVGHAYLGRYAVWKSSGTTGMPGLYLHDPSALAVYDALDALRLGAGALGPIAASPAMLATGARYAMVAATGGHYAGVASVERLRLLTRALGDGMRVFSIFDPLARLVAALNDWQPAFVATHPTVADTLAAERRAGRLHIRPAAFWLGGENLSIAQRARIREAFGCVVLEQYGTSECMSIACECACGSLHLNSDWVVLEPVDRDYRPVPAGTMSYTALLTNLANRVQPIIRYDLGDRILIDTRDCPCGSPLPVLRIEGRTDEVLRLKTASGAVVDLPPVALATVIEECAGTHPFQVVQSGPQTLELRFENGTGERYARTSRRALRVYLDMQGLTNVAITGARRPLIVNARSGKLQRVLARQ